MLKMSGNSNKQKKHCYICAHFKIIIMIFFYFIYDNFSYQPILCVPKRNIFITKKIQVDNFNK